MVKDVEFIFSGVRKIVEFIKMFEEVVMQYRGDMNIWDEKVVVVLEEFKVI